MSAIRCNPMSQPPTCLAMAGCTSNRNSVSSATERPYLPCSRTRRASIAGTSSRRSRPSRSKPQCRSISTLPRVEHELPADASRLRVSLVTESGDDACGLDAVIGADEQVEIVAGPQRRILVERQSGRAALDDGMVNGVPVQRGIDFSVARAAAPETAPPPSRRLSANSARPVRACHIGPSP